MPRVIFGIFIVLHGVVHLLYFGQSQRLFELQPGMDWPDGSWAFSGILGNGATRMLANILLLAAALGFVVGGIGLIVAQAWALPVVAVTAALSAATYLLLWNGRFRQLDNNGGVGLLIDLAVLALILVVQWPDL